MRVSKDYMFDLIAKLGDTIQKRLTERGIKDADPGRDLRELQRRLAYGDVRPREALTRLHEIAETHYIAGEEWKSFMRSIAL